MPWTQHTTTFTSVRDGNSLTVSAAGGRIQSVRVQDREILEQAARQTGSTFWTSPQADWSWPPLEEHDMVDYQATVTGDSLYLESLPDHKLGLVIGKRFRWLEPGIIESVFSIRNAGTVRRKVAPWQISRVPAGGLSFFESGDPAALRGDLELRQENGFAFFRHRAEDQKKSFADAAQGWLAHAGVDTVLLKVFPGISPAEFAPGEAEIELYAAYDYVEVEQQGAYRELAPGASMDWKVLWCLHTRETFAADSATMAGQVRDRAHAIAATWL